MERDSKSREHCEVENFDPPRIPLQLHAPSRATSLCQVAVQVLTLDVSVFLHEAVDVGPLQRAVQPRRLHAVQRSLNLVVGVQVLLAGQWHRHVFGCGDGKMYHDEPYYSDPLDTDYSMNW